MKRICIALDGPLRDPCHTSVQYIRIPPAMTMLTFDLPPLKRHHFQSDNLVVSQPKEIQWRFTDWDSTWEADQWWR